MVRVEGPGVAGGADRIPGDVAGGRPAGGDRDGDRQRDGSLVAAVGGGLGRTSSGTIVDATCPRTGAARGACRTADRCIRSARVRPRGTERANDACGSGRDSLRADLPDERASGGYRAELAVGRAVEFVDDHW